jgi:hypothetical protein
MRFALSNPEKFVQLVSRMKDDAAALDVQLNAIMVDWRSWRILAQYINMTAMRVGRYEPTQRLFMFGVEIQHPKEPPPVEEKEVEA